MLGFLIRATFGTIVLGFVAYFVLMVPVGRRTLLEHAEAIGETKPAQELAEDLGSVTQHALAKLRASLDP